MCVDRSLSVLIVDGRLQGRLLLTDCRNTTDSEPRMKVEQPRACQRVGETNFELGAARRNELNGQAYRPMAQIFLQVV